MESYIRQIQSMDITPVIHNSDTSKRKREDCGLEDIRIRVENLLGLATELVNRRDKSCKKIITKSETSINSEDSASIKTPSRIPRRSNSFKETPESYGKSRSVTPQRVVQSRIQYFEALSHNKDVFRTILSQERELGIERTAIPVAVNMKTSQRGHLGKPQVPLFNQVTPTQEKSVFLFKAPTPVRGIPRLVGRKTAAIVTKKRISVRNYNPDTPSKIPVLDKSKFFAGESRMRISRKTG